MPGGHGFIDSDGWKCRTCQMSMSTDNPTEGVRRLWWAQHAGHDVVEVRSLRMPGRKACTGVAATYCPVCGDCSCPPRFPRMKPNLAAGDASHSAVHYYGNSCDVEPPCEELEDDDGERTLDDPNCHLHSFASRHAEAGSLTRSGS